MMVARARAVQGPFTVVVIAGFLAACAGQSAPVGTAGTPYAAGGSSRVDTIIRNAKQEVTNLRAGLGAARIAATKKDVEAEELRRDVTHYRQRLSELQQAGNQQQYAGDKQQQELTALKVEREQLMRDKLDMQRELAELPQLREALAARRATEEPERVKELEGIIATLTDELAKAKATGARDDNQSGDGQTSREPPVGATSVSPAHTQGSALSSGGPTKKSAALFVTAVSSMEPAETVVTVKSRDTLWDLARLHGVAIEQLKAANRLAGDTIHIGQTLRIPSRKLE